MIDLVVVHSFHTCVFMAIKYPLFLTQESPLSRARSNSSIPADIQELGDQFSALHDSIERQ